jgi:hypothetical protein
MSARELLLLIALVFGCGSDWVPLYPGEPKCGSPRLAHAIEGAPCPEEGNVACDCDERRTLKCSADGGWSYSHWLCSGVGVSVPKDGGP